MSYDTDRTEDNPVADDAEASQETEAQETGAQGSDAAGSGGGGDDDGEPRGSADPGKKFREMEISEEEQREIAEERERRLDPDNRPDNAEVDNTHRTFEDGKFVD